MAKQPFVIDDVNFQGKRDQFGRPIVEVNRKTWACGSGTLGPAMLLNDRGNQCCLGFASEQLGSLSSKALLGCEMPNDLEPFLLGSPVAEGWDDQNNDGVVMGLLTSTAEINDQIVGGTFTHKDRERLLKSQALKLGFVFKFIGRSPATDEELARRP